jgi:hypothetical protein
MSDEGGKMFFSKPEEARAAGIPEPIIKMVEGLGRLRDQSPATKPRPSIRGSFEEVRDRIERITTYWRENPDKEHMLHQAWRKIERFAHTEGRLINLFLTMPDSPERPSILLIPLERTIDVGEQKDRQLKLLENINKVLEFFYDVEKLKNANQSTENPVGSNPGSDKKASTLLADKEGSKSMRFMEGKSKRYRELSEDAWATGEAARIAYNEFDEIRYEFLYGLKRFRSLVSLVDPAAKVPTKQWKSHDADLKNYYNYLAALNNELKTPQHTALAMIATANNPMVPVEADTLRKCWQRGADKLTRF